MKEKRLIIVGILLIFAAVVFAYYLIIQERERHMVLQEPDFSEADLESSDLKRQSLGEQIVDLYFYNPGKLPADPDFLVPEQRVIYQIADRTLMAKQVILELFRGPQAENSENAAGVGQGEAPGEKISSSFPQESRLRQLFILEDGTAVVDLSSETVNNIDGIFYELLVIESITRSLVMNFEDITQVRFLVEGSEQDSLAGHVSISHPFRVE